MNWRVAARRRVRNRLATAAVTAAFGVALVALVAVVAVTVARGAGRLTATFLTHAGGARGGGVAGAIVGTLEQAALAGVVAVPVGLLVAVYLGEYGGSRLARSVRRVVDLLSGVPSVVVGLFVLGLWVLALGRGHSGTAAGLALAVLIAPLVARAGAEALLAVPAELREAAYALGVPRWRAIAAIVAPAAAGGLVTAVLLALARAVGETAPALLTAGSSRQLRADPFAHPQANLAVDVFDRVTGATPSSAGAAWAAALTLTGIVGVLYLAARLSDRRGVVPPR